MFSRFVADSRSEPFEGQQEFGGPLAGADDIPGGAEGGLMTATAARNGGVRVYSFGRGDLGALLHSDDAGHAAAEGPVALKNHWSVLQVWARHGSEGGRGACRPVRMQRFFLFCGRRGVIGPWAISSVYGFLPRFTC